MDPCAHAQIRQRRPDLVVKQTASRTIHIVDVACTWEPLAEEREREKTAKYQHLKVDLAQQHRRENYAIFVVPVVLGDLGIICGTRGAIIDAGLLSPAETDAFLDTAQREVLVQNLRLIKTHLAGPTNSVAVLHI